MIPTFELNNGLRIPKVALGTWQSDPGQVKTAVKHALQVGYKHIDCAFVYGNEAEVGQGLKQAFATGIEREDIFVTSKLWNNTIGIQKHVSMKDSEDWALTMWTYPNGNDPLFPKLADGSRDLDKEWPHWETWQEMEKLLNTGKVKAIGVSNYSVQYLEELLEHCKIVPAVDQIEHHPFLPQQDIHDFCKNNGILVEAYNPLGSIGSPLFEEDAVQRLAKHYNVGPGTILISYQVGKGHVVLPKSITPARIEQNLKVVDLKPSELQALDEIHKTKGVKRFVYPPFGVDLGFPDKR